MKKFFLLILLAIVAVTGVDARTFVLSCGVSNYGDGVNDLGNPSKDAKHFKEIMSSQTKDITLLTSKNVSKANVLEKLSAICNRAQKGDRIIYYFSGHGAPGMMCGYNGSMISYEDVLNMMSKSAASEKILLVDACLSGTAQGAIPDLSKSIKGRKDMAIFVSSRADENSLDDPVLGAGAFSQSLFKGLRGKADKDGNRKITIMELFKYIYGDVLKHTNSKQHPQLIAPENMYNSVIYVWK